MENNTLSYRMILEGGENEIVEKKSRFIATIKKVDTIEEATYFIEEIKKKYWDARHNCSAFVIGEKGECTRCNDDGEPSGTAGRPMLEVLLGENLCNVAVVVTRYFGGTLLGTGGLVRAYTQCVKEGLKSCKVGKMILGYQIEIETDYNYVGKILYILESYKIVPINSTYYQKINIIINIPINIEEKLRKIGRAHV